MSGKISHIGTIDSISAGMVHVRITQNSACSSCKVASHCTSAESKEKVIDVRCADAERYSIGQEVNVMASTAVGMKAVILAFVIPTIVLMSVIIGCIMSGTTELTAALSGLLSLLPYYIILYLCRGYIEKELTFWIES